MTHNTSIAQPSHKVAFAMALQFSPAGSPIRSMQKISNGLINQTFLVEQEKTAPNKFILQQLNMKVFPRPELITRNILTVTEYLASQNLPTPVLQLPQLLVTQNKADHIEDEEGNYWRALTCIDNAQCFDTIQNDQHAFEIGQALGSFHTMLKDLSIAKLSETIPNFHNTPLYLAELSNTLQHSRPRICPETSLCLQFIQERSPQAAVLENAFKQGVLTKRPIHGDPKINNFMMDITSNRIASLIDLDTIQPGLVLSDIADCLRSGCNTKSEDHENWKSVQFDLARCTKILTGYLATARHSLTPNDFTFLFDAIRLIPFELGVRFLSDHLKGNVYFQTSHPKHNLQRALVQLQLCSSIEKQKNEILQVIEAS